MRILCFGDSNTYGYDPRSYLGNRYEPENRWTDLLAIKTGWEIDNAGICGQEIPVSMPSFPIFHGYDCLLIMLGTNDLLQGRSAEETADRMEHFLDSLFPVCDSIILIAPPTLVRGTWVPSDDLVAASVRLLAAYKKIAEKAGIAFVDTHTWNTELAFDGVHFTEAGHRNFATHLHSSIFHYL